MLDGIDNKDLIVDVGKMEVVVVVVVGGVLCGSGDHTSPPLPQSKQSSLGTVSLQE